MEFVAGIIEREDIELKELLLKNQGDSVIVEGAVHSIRNMGEISFIILRKRDGLIQTVLEENKLDCQPEKVREGDFIRVRGTVRDEERAPHGKEICIENYEHITKISEAMPIAIDKWKLGTSLETKLDNRALVLRNIRESKSPSSWF